MSKLDGVSGLHLIDYIVEENYRQTMHKAEEAQYKLRLHARAIFAEASIPRNRDPEKAKFQRRKARRLMRLLDRLSSILDERPPE